MSVEDFSSLEFRENYKKTPITFRKIVFPCIFENLGDINEKSILDLGCGWGNFSYLLSKEGASVIGVDISSDWISECIQAYNEENLKFEIGDATDLKNQESDKFDIVVMNMVFIEFDSLEKVKKAFVEVSRVLKKGGKFLFTDIHPIDKVVEKTPTRIHSYPSSFSYFQDGSEYKSKVLLEDGSLIEFTDFNWKLETFTDLLNKNGFCIEKIVEPKSKDEFPALLDSYKFPEYLLFSCKKI